MVGIFSSLPGDIHPRAETATETPAVNAYFHRTLCRSAIPLKENIFFLMQKGQM